MIHKFILISLKSVATCFALLSCISMEAYEYELNRSKQAYKILRSKNCLIKTPLYDGPCTHLASSTGEYSTNLHFYSDEERIISFIVQNSDYQNPSKDGSILKYKFMGVWDKNNEFLQFKGSCLESDKDIECTSEDLAYMSSIWAN